MNMNLSVLVLILISVSLSALAQVALKVGMSSQRVLAALGPDAKQTDAVFAILSSQHVVLGMFLYICGALLWLRVLAKVDVSLAYPFVGLGFILTMLLGFFFLGESFGIARVVGTLLVFAGVILISHT